LDCQKPAGGVLTKDVTISPGGGGGEKRTHEKERS